jgi:tRNA(Ile2) C34 agmatinyltransferase TiaS
MSRPPDYPPGHNNALAYCPHCKYPLFSYGAKKCHHCGNPIKWPKKKPVERKMVIVRR